ncbi:MAG: DUF308 domain-containing protein [Bacteroidetes bacterium]|nr:DUF308 domain-containing protein [Bacteroidota bacterium]
MRTFLHRIWLPMLITGILSLLFGFFALAMPGITLIALAWLFAISVLVQGAMMLSGAWSARRIDSGWWVVALLGLVEVVVGIWALWMPGITALVLIALMGWCAMLVGLLQVVWAWRVRKVVRNEGWIIAGGILSILFGLWVIARPGGGALALIVLVATYAIVYGVTLIVAALRARKWGNVASA